MKNKILTIFSRLFKKNRNDGVETWADGYGLRIENISAESFFIGIKEKTMEIKWSSIEFIMAYRTNRIKNSPIHIDLWSEEGGSFPFNATMKGWDELIEKLPTCLPLQNFAMLKTRPWTHNVMTTKLFTLLYDKKGRTIAEVYNWKYAGDGIKM
jgi:hypothetical protein